MRKYLALIISLACVALMINAAEPNLAFSNRVFFTSVIIQIVSIFSIFSKENEPYSLYKIFFLFSFFFFGVAPLLQFYHNTNLWYSRPLTENEYYYTNIIVIMILLFYKVFYSFFRRLNISSRIENRIASYTINNQLSSTPSLLFVLISTISFIVVFRTNNNDIFSMFLRGGDFTTASSVLDSSLWLIIANFVRPLSMMVLLYYIISPKKNYLIYSILFLLTLITCSPTGMPRYAAAAMYIPLILLLFSFMRKKHIFNLVFVFGLFLVFPFLNNFRNYSDSNDIKLGFDFNMFLAGDFDSYQNFALIVSNNLITYGRQLLGVLCFWIPRTIWPEKPIGSGAFTADKLNFIWDNVSANFFAEGFINFGLLGIFLFVILLAYITAKADKIYWTKIIFMNNNYFTVLYMLTLGMLFFILRGDLLSSFAYTVGFLLSAIFVFKIVNLKVSNNL